MKAKSRVRYEARAAIIKAMAHPARLMIVDELSRRERCVNELTEMIGSDISTVSRHLTVLKGAGIVRDEKRGSRVYYILRTPCILNFLSCVETVIKSTAEEQLDLAK
jgi:ArsR family transcriptional regulator